MIGRTREHPSIRPQRRSHRDFEICEKMLRYFITCAPAPLRQAAHGDLRASASRVERRAVMEAAEYAARGALHHRRAMAAASCRLPVTSRRHMVVDIGGGTTEVAYSWVDRHSQSVRIGATS